MFSSFNSKSTVDEKQMPQGVTAVGRTTLNANSINSLKGQQQLLFTNQPQMKVQKFSFDNKNMCEMRPPRMIGSSNLTQNAGISRKMLQPQMRFDQQKMADVRGPAAGLQTEKKFSSMQFPNKVPMSEANYTVKSYNQISRRDDTNVASAYVIQNRKEQLGGRQDQPRVTKINSGVSQNKSYNGSQQIQEAMHQHLRRDDSISRLSSNAKTIMMAQNMSRKKKIVNSFVNNLRASTQEFKIVGDTDTKTVMENGGKNYYDQQLQSPRASPQRSNPHRGYGFGFSAATMNLAPRYRRTGNLAVFADGSQLNRFRSSTTMAPRGRARASTIMMAAARSTGTIEDVEEQIIMSPRPSVVGSKSSGSIEEIMSNIDQSIKSRSSSFSDKGEPKMYVKRRSKSSNQFQLTINFDLDEIDNHHLSSQVKQRIIQAFKEAEEEPKTKIKSLEQLSQDQNKLDGLIKSADGTTLNEDEYRNLTKAILASISVEMRQNEMKQQLERMFLRNSVYQDKIDPLASVHKNDFDVYMTPQQEKEYMEGKPVVIMKQMHELYNKLYLEKHEAHTTLNTLPQLNQMDDIERRMQEYIDRNFDGLDAVEVPEGNDNAAWDKMFDAYKFKTHKTEDEAWDEIINQYQRTHQDEEEEELPFKTIGELIHDYFETGEDGHVCEIDKEVPQYFYYKGKKFQIDFTILDDVHEHVMDFKKENGQSVEEALAFFTEVGGSHFDPDHGHEEVGDIHLIQKPKVEEKKGPLGLKWNLNLFKNGEIVQGEGPEVTAKESKDKLDQYTDEELMMMAGDGLFAGLGLPEKFERHVPKRIDVIDEEIESFVESKSRAELKKEHGPHGGYVLYDHEYEKYKGYFQIVAAAKQFEMAFPELVNSGTLRYSTAEFTQFYVERQAIIEEIENFTPNKMLHELSEPEIKEFFEFLHQGWEMGLEDKVHALSQIHPEQYHLFEKFVGLISKNPQFFDNITHIIS